MHRILGVSGRRRLSANSIWIKLFFSTRKRRVASRAASCPAGRLAERCGSVDGCGPSQGGSSGVGGWGAARAIAAILSHRGGRPSRSHKTCLPAKGPGSGAGDEPCAPRDPADAGFAARRARLGPGVGREWTGFRWAGSSGRKAHRHGGAGRDCKVPPRRAVGRKRPARFFVQEPSGSEGVGSVPPAGRVVG